jgi:hypothetical protein
MRLSIAESRLLNQSQGIRRGMGFTREIYYLFISTLYVAIWVPPPAPSPSSPAIASEWKTP